MDGEALRQLRIGFAGEERLGLGGAGIQRLRRQAQAGVGGGIDWPGLSARRARRLRRALRLKLGCAERFLGELWIVLGDELWIDGLRFWELVGLSTGAGAGLAG